MNEFTNASCMLSTPSCTARNSQGALKVILSILGGLLAFTIGLIVGAFISTAIIEAIAAVFVLAGLLFVGFVVVLIYYFLTKRRCCCEIR